MDLMKRYAVYYAPPAGEFWDRASQWLGRDAVTGADLVPPDLGLEAAALTRDPRRYGFHGTVKPPFRLADGATPDALHEAMADLCASLAPVQMPGLRLANLHGFLALIPEGDTTPLAALAAEVVKRLDGFRAPLTAEEIARRRPERLSLRQRELLYHWGYPYVMEEFRFHLTLTDRLADSLVPQAVAILAAHFSPVLPAPFRIDSLCLFGEGLDGRFHLIHRYPLSG